MAKPTKNKKGKQKAEPEQAFSPIEEVPEPPEKEKGGALSPRVRVQEETTMIEEYDEDPSDNGWEEHGGETWDQGGGSSWTNDGAGGSGANKSSTWDTNPAPKNMTAADNAWGSTATAWGTTAAGAGTPAPPSSPMPTLVPSQAAPALATAHAPPPKPTAVPMQSRGISSASANAPKMPADENLPLFSAQPAQRSWKATIDTRKVPASWAPMQKGGHGQPAWMAWAGQGATQPAPRESGAGKSSRRMDAQHKHMSDTLHNILSDDRGGIGRQGGSAWRSQGYGQEDHSRRYSEPDRRYPQADRRHPQGNPYPQPNPYPESNPYPQSNPYPEQDRGRSKKHRERREEDYADWDMGGDEWGAGGDEWGAGGDEGKDWAAGDERGRQGHRERERHGKKGKTDKRKEGGGWRDGANEWDTGGGGWDAGGDSWGGKGDSWGTQGDDSWGAKGGNANEWGADGHKAQNNSWGAADGWGAKADDWGADQGKTKKSKKKDEKRPSSARWDKYDWNDFDDEEDSDNTYEREYDDGGWGDEDQYDEWDAGGQSRKVRFQGSNAKSAKVPAAPAIGRTTGATYTMPSKTLAHAYADMKDSVDLNYGYPPKANSMQDYMRYKFKESAGAALKPVWPAFYGTTTRMAKDRFHWDFSPDNDERVSEILSWIQAMSYGLGTLGLHKFLQTRERGALICNATFRLPDAPKEPVFDWLTFDMLQPTMDRIFQESVATYDPLVKVIVFVILPSASGRSVAAWRRKIPVPNNLRLAYIAEINQTLHTLKRNYKCMVDELPPPSKATAIKKKTVFKRSVSPAVPGARSKLTKTEKTVYTKEEYPKKKKWWHININW